MNYSESLFKFATIRNASNEVKTNDKVNIQPKTVFTKSILQVLESDKKNEDKISSINQKLDAFIKSTKFYKSSKEIDITTQKYLADVSKESKVKKDDLKNIYENLYDNIVTRIITKGNTNEIFFAVVETIKKAHKKLYPDVKEGKMQIFLPKGLNISLSVSKQETEEGISNTANNTGKIIADEIKNLYNQKSTLQSQAKEHNAKIITEQEKLNALQAKIVDVKVQNSDTTKNLKAKAKVSGITKPQEKISFDKLNLLHAEYAELENKDLTITKRLQDLHSEMANFIPQKTYANIAGKYVDVTKFEEKRSTVEEDGITVYTKDCKIKFPFQIADLRVVEQKVVGYLPNEIAHINNTQPGEKNIRTTRRLKRVETFESLINEDEITKETDTQSTEKFSLEKAASEVQSEETNINVNASVSGTYGVVTASLDAGFSHSEASQNSNSSSQSYAKEVVQKVVDRVSHKVKMERSIKSIEEFEETVKHIIDNTESNDPKSYVYRWLTKIVRATLKNYGKRLILQLDIAHPSHYYLSRSLKQPDKVDMPIDPRTWSKNGNLIQFTIDNITRDNYQLWEMLYNVKLEAPPIEKKMYSISDLTNKDITIPLDYCARKCIVNFYVMPSDTGYAYIDIRVGQSFFSRWIIPNMKTQNYTEAFLLSNEEGIIPFGYSVPFSGFKNGIVEIELVLTNSAFEKWQTKCYFAIIEAYETLKTEAEAKMSEFNPNNPGLNPSRKNDIIKTELKKGAIQKMNCCNPFWLTDKYEVGKEYDPDCCTDNANAEKVRFWENTFDWNNMTYELHPYFYNKHSPNNEPDNWSKLLDLSDDDPHFEAFLQASYATVRVPVHREPNKEKAALNFIANNSIGNFTVLPDGVQNLLDDLESNTPFGFIDETPTAIPFVKIIKEYDKHRNLKIYYVKEGSQVLCTEKKEWDKEGNETKFYYNTSSDEMVISEIKEGFNEDGQKYHYYFNSANEKIITHKTKTEYNIDGTSQPYYATDLGIFHVPTDLVILEAGVQNGVEVRGYPEDATTPNSDVIIPKQYSPAIIQK